MKIFNYKGAILEINTGKTAHPRSDVVVTGYFEDASIGPAARKDWQYWIISDPENLPFQDQAFAYSLVTEVPIILERPDKFLEDLMRISKTGHIETASAFAESLNPERTSRWLIKKEHGELIFFPQKKAVYLDLRVISELSHLNFGYKWFRKSNRQLFRIRVDWQNHIGYRLEKRSFHPDEYLEMIHQNFLQFFMNTFQQIFGSFFRRIFNLTYHKRHRVDIGSLLRCPRCFSGLKMETDRVMCSHCNGYYLRKGNALFLSKEYFNRL